MGTSKILVTGGAGYIGSHVVRQLGDAGEDVITLDNLSTGFEAAVTSGELVIGDTGDAALLDRLFAAHDIDTVMHFAAHTVVPESVSDPLKYYGNNTASSRTLLERAHAHGVKNVVFSSTAAVYGIPPEGKASEGTATKPINPYGSSKLMTEWMLRDLAFAGGPSYVALRYFNVAGCDPGGAIGQSTPNATLLVKVACEAAVGIRPGVKIFGTDYPTSDGTCIRDYIHVMDLCEAHLLALGHLIAGKRSARYNLGNGLGYSVQQVIDAAREVTGRTIAVRYEPRRAGDPARLVADSTRAKQELGWRPQCAALERIIADAWAWEQRRLPARALSLAV